MASACPDHSLSCHLGKSYFYLVVTEFLFLFISLPLKTNSLSFEFPSFVQSSLDLQGDAFVSNSQIQLTNAVIGASVGESYGRALYPKAIQLWDASPKRLADFTTNFNFTIAQASSTTSGEYGDGLTFFLVPENTSIPNDSGGGCLALFSLNQNHTGCVLNQTIVAIEFDTHRNLWDPYGDQDHIGIDINSIQSETFVNVSFGLMNKIVQAFISYDSTTKNLSVSLSINESSVQVSYSPIDLSDVLPQKVQVGFSAATGLSVELHKILAWSFNSTLEERVAPSPNPASTQGGAQGRWSKSKAGLVAGIGMGIFLILIFGTTIVWFILRRNIEADQFDIDEDFDDEAGPKRFTYSELSEATNNFSLEGKLGEGGFGGVYKGLLTSPRRKEIAVKRIKSGSTQGKDEYISEVKIISKLRHRNLVQLLGWCHGHGELLLVYEFMPNRSLDSHLFKGQASLHWQTRYKIALGLASALLYLHEEWEKSVVHRDIKSSNVMLDSNFNPKLADFGLARLADHDADLKTTNPAGTLGYLAPECYTGKVSKESDVYSFGIVALELACGRKVIERREEDSKLNLVEWVWDLYGKGLILESVDSRLEGEFDEEQAKCLLLVGMWCSYLEVSYRPSIKQAISALNLETLIPSFNSFPPQTSYVSSGMNMSLLSSSSTNISSHRMDD